MTPPGPIWAIVLVKGFAAAKTRLAPALDPPGRQALARANAGLALHAAQVADHVLAVAGDEEAAELARKAGCEVLVEPAAEGQSRAAQRGLEHAGARGAAAALLLSSDLPLVTGADLTALLERARALQPPAVLAAPATGRGGTNALFLNPLDAVGLHFGDQSLRKFAADAAARGATFELFESAALALDLDEPADLDLLAAAR